MDSEMPYFLIWSLCIKRLVHHEVYCISWSCLLSFLYDPYNYPFYFMSPFIFVLILAVTVIGIILVIYIDNNKSTVVLSIYRDGYGVLCHIWLYVKTFRFHSISFLPTS